MVVMVVVVVQGVRRTASFLRGAGRRHASCGHRSVAMTASVLLLLIDNDIPQNIAHPKLDVVGTAEAWPTRHRPFHGAVTKPDPAKVGTRIPRVSGCRRAHVKHPARDAPTESGSGTFGRGKTSATTGTDRLRVQVATVAHKHKGEHITGYSYLGFFEQQGESSAQ